MKRLIVLGFYLSIVLLFAEAAGTSNRVVPSDAVHNAGSFREAPLFSFVQGPDTLSTDYYGYFFGGYNNLALQAIPQSHSGGYFTAFHARKNPGGLRRVYWAHINALGVLQELGPINSVEIHEGYPALAVDQESGIPMYVWHANCDDDGELELMFCYDSFSGGTPGNLSEAIPVIDNPVTVQDTEDNEFIHAEIKIGPSPNAGMRRVYIAAKNISSHSLNGRPVESVMIAYADFSTLMLQEQASLNWVYSTVPMLDSWNHDTVINRRPFLSFNVDTVGNLYLIGYHHAHDADFALLPEEDLDVFMCPNYGDGQWVHHSYFSSLDTWNPPAEPDANAGYFADDDLIPYSDEELSWKLWNSGHFNAVVDHSGRLRSLGLWALTANGTNVFPAFHTVKSYIFDPLDESMSIQDIYPQGSTENVAYPYFTPWDMQAPWQEVDNYYTYEGDSYPEMMTIFPFPYWDYSALDSAMPFHYNHVKLTEVNAENMMAAVWQDSQKAQRGNLYPDEYPECIDYIGTPEIVISVSPDGGESWSEPIYLNNLDTPQLAGIKPMWVYPASQIQYMGLNGQNKVGRLGLLFLNDQVWGAAHILNPHIMADSTMLMYTALDIVFPLPVANSDAWEPSPGLCRILKAYPNPFHDHVAVSAEIKAGDYTFKVFNIKGQCVYKSRGSGKGKLELGWNGYDAKGKKAANGIYLLQLRTADGSSSKKVILY